MDFNGTFDHTLDAKNRVTLPSRFRARLSGTIFVVRSDGPCLSVYEGDLWSQLKTQSLGTLPPLSPTYRDLQRYFSGRAQETELDGAGRVPLRGPQLEHAGFAGRDVTVVGAGICLELWDPAAWRARDATLSEQAGELLASLGHPA